LRGQIRRRIDSAVERGLLVSNPALGRKRRLKTSKPVRRLLEADELRDLLAVAAEMDRTSHRYRIGRRPMIAVTAKSGLRVTAMCRLQWRDVDLHHQRLIIREAKTDAGLMIEAGAPLPYVMRRVGHEDSRTTLEVYARVQQRLSRKQVHQAFDDLLASAGETADVPTDGREKMSRSTIASSPQCAEIGEDEEPKCLVVRGSGPQTQTSSSEDDAQPDQRQQKPRTCEAFGSGARGTRTPDLLGAIQALSQLSYSPVRRHRPRGRPSLAACRGLTGMAR
jgi:hypothetical protein